MNVRLFLLIAMTAFFGALWSSDQQYQETQMAAARAARKRTAEREAALVNRRVAPRMGALRSRRLRLPRLRGWRLSSRLLRSLCQSANRSLPRVSRRTRLPRVSPPRKSFPSLCRSVGQVFASTGAGLSTTSGRPKARIPGGALNAIWRDSSDGPTVSVSRSRAKRAGCGGKCGGPLFSVSGACSACLTNNWTGALLSRSSLAGRLGSLTHP